MLCLALIDNYKIVLYVNARKAKNYCSGVENIKHTFVVLQPGNKSPQMNRKKKFKKFCFRNECVHCRQNTLKFCVVYQGAYVSRKIVSTAIKTRLLKSTGSQKIEFLPVNGLAHLLTALKIRRRTLIVLH